MTAPAATGSPRLDGVVGWPRELAARYRAAGWWSGGTLGALLDQAAAHGERIALVDGARRLSYAELAARSRRLAAGLLGAGLRRDDRVVVQLPNTAAFVELLFALARIGALPIMALPPHREHEIGYMVDHAEAVAYAGPAEHKGFAHLAMARGLQRDRPGLRLLLGTGPDLPDGTVDLDRLAEGGEEDTGAEGPDGGDVALFLLSGGTTGLPKLIPRTHEDYLYNATASAELCGLGRDTVSLVALPVAHNFPLACPGVLGTIAAGGRVVMAHDPSPSTAFELIESERVTITAVVPAVALRWLDAPERAAFDLSSLEVLQVGGARLAPEAARRVRPELDATLQQVFGMAEGLLNYTRLDDPEQVIVETQGRPLSPGDEIRIVDAFDRPVAAGEAGELQARGPYTLCGYYRAAEHNARAFTADGFYRTGDVVRRDARGNLIVEGRSKDLINRGGEKISAEEVENLMLAHPAVAACAAVAMPDPDLGERTCAYAVLHAGARLDLAGLCAFMTQRRIAKFKLPERLEVVEELPVTSVGKIDKKALREDVRDRLAAEVATT